MKTCKSQPWARDDSWRVELTKSTIWLQTSANCCLSQLSSTEIKGGILSTWTSSIRGHDLRVRMWKKWPESIHWQLHPRAGSWLERYWSYESFRYTKADLDNTITYRSLKIWHLKRHVILQNVLWMYNHSSGRLSLLDCHGYLKINSSILFTASVSQGKSLVSLNHRDKAK